jgi:transcriptional regulator
MYVPKAFAVEDLPTLHDFIDRHSFGLLVSRSEGRPFGSHLPFLLDREAGPHGTLIAHVARANPQWKDLAGQDALSVFSGPHAYVSPTWYAEPRTVPTWNYTAVHVYGRVEVVEDPTELVEFVGRLTASAESTMPEPWTFDPADPFVRRLAEGIVGLRIEITQIEGKFKLNQNHPAERRARVIAALEAAGGENNVGVAEMMRETYT